MIIIDNFFKLINNLPLVLQYIIPGAICLSIYTFSVSKRLSEKVFVVGSCAISYMLIIVSELVYGLLAPQCKYETYIKLFMSIVFGIVITAAISILVNTKCFRKLTVSAFHKTINKNIWNNVIDFKNGSAVDVYFKDRNYYIRGNIKNIEENGNDSWFSVVGYSKYDIFTNMAYENCDHLNEYNRAIVVRLSDVDYIEIF